MAIKIVGVEIHRPFHKIITFQWLMADKEKWAQMQDPASEGYAMYQGLLNDLVRFADSPHNFRQQVTALTEKYFEPLERRNSDTYAEAYSRFYARMIFRSAWFQGEDYEQSFPMEMNFVPMMYPDKKETVFIAEKTTFNSLMDFCGQSFIADSPRETLPAAATTVDGTSC